MNTRDLLARAIVLEGVLELPSGELSKEPNIFAALQDLDLGEDWLCRRSGMLDIMTVRIGNYLRRFGVTHLVEADDVLQILLSTRRSKLVRVGRVAAARIKDGRETPVSLACGLLGRACDQQAIDAVRMYRRGVADHIPLVSGRDHTGHRWIAEESIPAPSVSETLASYRVLVSNETVRQEIEGAILAHYKARKAHYVKVWFDALSNGELLTGIKWCRAAGDHPKSEKERVRLAVSAMRLWESLQPRILRFMDASPSFQIGRELEMLK